MLYNTAQTNSTMEKAQQFKILKFLKSKGVWAVKVARANSRGVPDILCCYRNHFLAFEVKTPRTLCSGRSKLQKNKVVDIIKSGGFAFFVSDVAQVENIINLLDNNEIETLKALQQEGLDAKRNKEAVKSFSKHYRGKALERAEKAKV